MAYYLFLQRGYRLGDFSLVYSIARGIGPVLSSIVAILFLGKRPGVLGILGIMAIGVGIFFLAGGSASEHQSCDHSWSTHQHVDCDLYCMGQVRRQRDLCLPNPAGSSGLTLFRLCC